MTEVERTTEFEDAPAEVWDALVDEALLGEWFGGEVSVDLRPGGALRVTLPRGERHAIVDDVDAPTHLSFTWMGDDGRPPSKVDVDLEPHDRGCTMRVREVLILVPAFPIGFQPPRAQTRQSSRHGEARALARS